MLLPRHLENPGARERFAREARLMGGIRHPNLVEIYDCAIEGPRPFLAMEYVEGRTLEEAGAAGFLPEARLLEIADDLLAALDTLHARGVVHRDVKPANVLLRTRDESPVLLDLGLASVAADPITATGMFVGTPRYLGPEVWRGLPVDLRTDLFALGATLFELSTGRPLLDSSTLSELSRRAGRGRYGEWPPGSVASRGFRDLVDRLVDPDRDRRPGSASEARELVARAVAAQADAPTSTRRRSRSLAGPRPGGARALSGTAAVILMAFAVGVGLAPPAPPRAPGDAGPPGEVSIARLAAARRVEVEVRGTVLLGWRDEPRVRTLLGQGRHALARPGRLESAQLDAYEISGRRSLPLDPPGLLGAVVASTGDVLAPEGAPDWIERHAGRLATALAAGPPRSADLARLGAWLPDLLVADLPAPARTRALGGWSAWRRVEVIRRRLHPGAGARGWIEPAPGELGSITFAPGGSAAGIAIPLRPLRSTRARGGALEMRTEGITLAGSAGPPAAIALGLESVVRRGGRGVALAIEVGDFSYHHRPRLLLGSLELDLLLLDPPPDEGRGWGRGVITVVLPADLLPAGGDGILELRPLLAQHPLFHASRPLRVFGVAATSVP